MKILDKAKKMGSDIKQNLEITKKIHAGEKLTEEEIVFFETYHPNLTVVEEKKNFDENELLKLHKKITFGTNPLSFFVDEKGYYYFELEKTTTGARYILTDFVWNGPEYVLSSTSNTTGVHKKQGRSGSVITGATLGSIIAPGLGTLIGAVAGGSRKKNKKIHQQTETITERTEVDSLGTLTFINITSNEKKFKTIMCKLNTAEQIRKLKYSRPIEIKEIPNPKKMEASSPAEQLREYKELLDLGILTETEFELKKKKILEHD